MAKFSTIKVIQENIVKLKNIDAIVNAANNQLLPGGGVCGAIFQAAGEELNKECSQYIQQHGNVNTSQVVVTNSYLLKENQIKYILHAVGPIYYTSQDPENELFNCVQNILKISFNNLKLNTVAIPAISSGVYGFPKGMCAQIFKLAIEQYIQEETNNQGGILLCNFDQDTTQIFKEVFNCKNSLQ